MMNLITSLGQDIRLGQFIFDLHPKSDYTPAFRSQPNLVLVVEWVSIESQRRAFQNIDDPIRNHSALDQPARSIRPAPPGVWPRRDGAMRPGLRRCAGDRRLN